MSDFDSEIDPAVVDSEAPLELLSDKKVIPPEEMRAQLRQIIADGTLKEDTDNAIGDHDLDIMRP